VTMTALEFDGELVVVTGAASGIGEAIALRFAQEGAAVALVDINAGGLQRVADRITELPAGRCLTFVADVSDERAVYDLVDAVAAHGRVSVLVNQAGIIRRADGVDMPLELWDQVQRTNVTSMFLMCRSFIPRMLADGGGAIVNCSSGAAFESGRDLAAYSASKAAVVAFTRSLAVDYGPTIRSNAVCPGLIETPGAYFDANDTVAQARREAALRVPLARMGMPDEVAEVVVFLASQRARYCSGAAIMVDGGKLAAA
jgi:NAD(P)-dependent dehydrogenase (short-subunit alcohol dehydrogenase family)